MDQHGGAPGGETASDEGERERSASADRLVARLAELRGQLEVLAPQDQERGREAIERIREAQERIGALDSMLVAARTREHELTVEVVRSRAQITEDEARIAELGTIAARVATAEDARREAETTAVEKERALAVAHADAGALRAEIEKLRSRCGELEADLGVVSAEMAAAAIARTEAARLERERNEARERAHIERRLAATDRIRAAEAELRATELQSQLREAKRRIVQLTNGARDQESKAEADTGEQRATTEPPWIELQRSSSPREEPAAADEGPSSVSADEAPKPEAGADEEPEVIDLTAADEEPAPEETPPVEPGETDRARDEGWAASGSGSFLGRLIHPRRRQ